MSFNHAVVWIDHKEAHVIHFNAEASENEVIKTKSTHPHLHHKSGVIGSGRFGSDQGYLHDVILAVAEAKEILIVGPGSAKLDLVKHAKHHDAKVAQKIVGIETVDHPTDPQLLAFARQTFLKVDRMKGDQF